MEKLYYDAEYISDLLDVSKSKAYRIIRTMNVELKQKGFITIAGKIPKKYLEERCYGLVEKEA